MSVHLFREVEKLKKLILALGAMVEDQLYKAVDSVKRRNVKDAGKVIKADMEIDHTEVDIEEECLKTLALHQPVASDLRFIIAILKINSDLERIGDLAVNIAEQVAFLPEILPPVPSSLDFSIMAGKAQQMVKKSLDALVNLDAGLAREVCASDDAVDEINRNMITWAKNAVGRNPGSIDAIITLLMISRQLERIADHATNNAEDVIYMINGHIVRHATGKE